MAAFNIIFYWQKPQIGSARIHKLIMQIVLYLQNLSICHTKKSNFQVNELDKSFMWKLWHPKYMYVDIAHGVQEVTDRYDFEICSPKPLMDINATD